MDKLIQQLDDSGAYVKILRIMHSKKSRKEILAEIADLVFTADIEVRDAEFREYYNKENK